jgi:hypothetical protein
MDAEGYLGTVCREYSLSRPMAPIAARRTQISERG